MIPHFETKLFHFQGIVSENLAFMKLSIHLSVQRELTAFVIFLAYTVTP